MKRFIKAILVYILITLLIIVPVECFKMGTKDYVKTIEGFEIYCAITKSKEKTKVKRLILGDSVGCQLYPCDQNYDSIVSLACNQAITMAGQYFLLKSFVEINNEDLPEEIILLITPFSLINDVDQYAYHYFLKPFPLYEYSKYYTEHLAQRIHSIPLYWSANLPFIQTTNYSPQYAVPANKSVKSVSTTSYEYLLKMDSITSEHNIVFRMVSTPVRYDRREDVESMWYNLPSVYAETLEPLLKPYMESVNYLPSEWFRDKSHFVSEKVPLDYLGLLSDY